MQLPWAPTLAGTQPQCLSGLLAARRAPRLLWNTCVCSGAVPGAGAAAVAAGELRAAAAAVLRMPIPGQTPAPGLCLRCSCLLHPLGTWHLVWNRTGGHSRPLSLWKALSAVTPLLLGLGDGSSVGVPVQQECPCEGWVVAVPGAWHCLLALSPGTAPSPPGPRQGNQPQPAVPATTLNVSVPICTSLLV